MKRIAVFAALLVGSLAWSAPASEPSAAPNAQATLEDIQHTLGQVPSFLRDLPPEALPGFWSVQKSVELNPSSAVPGKYKELIGLAVAAQIPCQYCIYFHTQAAKLNGASDREIKEAIAISGLTRFWSTVLNGSQQDLTAFRQEFDRAMEYAQKQESQQRGTGGAGTAGGASNQAAPAPVTDAQSARQDMKATFGTVPTFAQQVPEQALAGAWNQEKFLDMSPNTAIPPKYKSLISLGVAAQVPCAYCLHADTASARQAGASQQEISEAITMAAITREGSTILNGNQPDLATFRKQTDQIIHYVKTHAQKAAPQP